MNARIDEVKIARSKLNLQCIQSSQNTPQFCFEILNMSYMTLDKINTCPGQNNTCPGQQMSAKKYCVCRAKIFMSDEIII